MVIKLFALLQFLSDWRDASNFVEWAKQVDDMLRQFGPTAEVLSSDLATQPPRRSWLGRVAESWLRKRGLQVLYRGQVRLARSEDFLSSIASGETSFRGETGLDASVKLAMELEKSGVSPYEMRAKWHSEPVFLPACPTELQGEPLGGAGIPFSERLPVAAAYARRREERVYITVQPVGDAKPVAGHGYVWEFERIALHRVSRKTIVLSMPGTLIPFFGPPY